MNIEMMAMNTAAQHKLHRELQHKNTISAKIDMEAMSMNTAMEKIL